MRSCVHAFMLESPTVHGAEQSMGIIGAFVGGSLAMLFTTGHLALTATTLSIPGIILAVLGAIVAVFFWRMLTRQPV